MKLLASALLLVALAPLSLDSAQRRPAARPVAPKPPAREIDIVLDGEERVSLGQLVTLDASATDADTFRWTLVGGGEGLYRVDSNGKVVYFSAGTPGDYVFVLACAKSSDEGPLLEVAEHVVSVEGPLPPTQPPVQPPVNPPVQPPVIPPAQPPVQPPQPPSPGDPLPEGRYGLARFSRDTANTLVPAGPKRYGPAEAMAAGYGVVAAQIKSGVIKDAADIRKAQQLVNTMILKQFDAASVWTSFFNKLAERLNDLGLAARDDYHQAWLEIQQGLAAVK